LCKISDSHEIEKWSATFSAKSQRVTISDFAAFQLCHFIVKAGIDDAQMNKWLYFNKTLVHGLIQSTMDC
jgi:hypothetical protein